MMQSAVDVTPVAFVKIATNNVGDIDFKLSPLQTTGVVDGNYNY